jgi:hypothetical protein
MAPLEARIEGSETRLLCLRPVRPVPRAWHEMPGQAAPRQLRPVRAVLSWPLRVPCHPSVRQRALRGALIWESARAFRSKPRGLRTHRGTISLRSLHSSVFLCASVFQNPLLLPIDIVGASTGSYLRTALTGRASSLRRMTRGCTPGWWNWPYRPKSQGGSEKWAVGSGQWAVATRSSQLATGNSQLATAKPKVACNSPAVITACKASSISLA